MENKYIGKWWCPGNERIVSGVLTIDDKGIFLETDNSLPKSTIINGHTTDNNLITLQGCINVGFSMNGYGNPSKYTANVVYVGADFESEDEIKFNKFSFRTSNLNEWMWNKPFEINTDYDANTFSLKYKLPETIQAEINNEYSIELETTMKPSAITVGKNNITITENAKVNFCVKSPKSLNEFLRLEYIFCCFMKIATGVNQNRYDVYGYIDNKKIEILIPQYNAYKEKEVLPPMMPFTFLQIKDRWENIISQWYKKYEENEDIWNLYFSINNSTRNYIQHSFIFYAQVIESYHRRNFDKEDRKEAKEKIQNLINSCPEEHQDFLKKALNFAHEITFKDRLEQLCDNCDALDSILNAQYKIDRKTFIKNIKDNRNYYTHYDESLEKKKLDIFSLHYITAKINMMIHYYMLKDIGFEGQERLEILKRLDTEIMIAEKLNELDEFVENLTGENSNKSEEDKND